MIGEDMGARLLLEALRSNSEIRRHGYTADLRGGTIIIERAGHFRGIWVKNADCFAWAAAGYNEPTFSTSSLTEALHHTVSELAKS